MPPGESRKREPQAAFSIETSAIASRAKAERKRLERAVRRQTDGLPFVLLIRAAQQGIGASVFREGVRISREQ